MTILDDGTYAEIDGRPAVTFERRYPVPADRVWRAITDPAELKHWFPSPNVEYEPRAGGHISLTGDPYDPEGSEGKVLAWEPPHRFVFEWEADQLELTVTPDGDGCRLRLVDFLATPGAAARNGAGWDFCLQSLEQTIAGQPGEAQAGGLGEFLPVLERYAGRGLPDDGWRPGDDAPPPGK